MFADSSEDDIEESLEGQEAESRDRESGNTALEGATGKGVPRLARAIQPLRLVICRPREFEDARVIVRSLKEGRGVIVNLSEASTDAAQRITDFVSGAIFLMQGTMQLQGDVLVCMPDTVRMETDDLRLRGNDLTMMWRLRE